jgi:hypothetical protein
MTIVSELKTNPMLLAMGLLCAGAVGALLGDSASQVLLGQALWLAAYKLGTVIIDWAVKG